jgi:hypothetical protein
MPEEPHKNIEDALKAYAQQRRDAAGGPLDMPSHTRAVLQREIAQRAAATQPKPAPRPWFEPLLALWPRLAVGAAAVAAVGIAMFVLSDIGQKARPPMELAQSESQSQMLSQESLRRSSVESDFGRKLEEKLSEDRRLAKAPAAPVVVAEPVAAQAAVPELKAMDKLDGVKVATRIAPAKAMPETSAPAKPQIVAMTAAPPPAAAPEPAPMLAAPAPAQHPPAAPMPATPPAEASKAGQADASRLVTAGVSNMAPLSQRLRFAQVVGNTEAEQAHQPRSQQPPPAQVLASFQLEQTGDRVVITDADGSVYEGQIQQASAAQQQVATERRVSRARVAQTRAVAPRQVMTQAGEFVWKEKDVALGRRLESGAAGQQLYFTAIGMNRSVNQRVLVSGVLSSPAEGTLAYGSPAGGGRTSFDAALAARFTPATSAPSSGVLDSNAMPAKSGQLVLPAAPAGAPVPAMPQASAQIEGTFRIGNAPDVELNAVGVGP